MAELMNRARLKKWLKLWIPPNLMVAYHHGRAFLSARSGGSGPLNTRQNLPLVQLGSLFPGIDPLETCIPDFLTYQEEEWALPLAEVLKLAAICRHEHPTMVFEIGTFKGISTLVMAMNTPAETQIHTLDLDPEIIVEQFSAQFTVGAAFKDTEFAAKIQQHCGDSRAFDFSPFYGKADIVFVDANHSYEFVKVDTENAFLMLRPGGILLWDDYAWAEGHPECIGVTRAVNEFAQSHPCFRLQGTRLAVHVKKGDE